MQTEDIKEGDVVVTIDGYRMQVEKVIVYDEEEIDGFKEQYVEVVGEVLDGPFQGEHEYRTPSELHPHPWPMRTEPERGDVIAIRAGEDDAVGFCKANICLVNNRHGRDIEWGYLGSGPASFAFSILCRWLHQEFLEEHPGVYQDFKGKYVARLPRGGGIITEAEIVAFLKELGYDFTEQIS